jgi:hypothetical protein
MKKIISCGVLVCMGTLSTLWAPCLNNAQGKQHVVTRKMNKKNSKTYFCSVKTKKSYETSRDPKMASRFYDGDACRKCGCSSSEHTDKPVATK